MFVHILVPVDGSAASDRAVQTAAATAKSFGSQVAIVSVVDPFPFSGVGADMAFAQGDYLEAAIAQAQRVTAAACALCDANGVPSTSSVIESQSVYAAIIDAAEAVGPAGADLIVMGSHGRTELEKLILGSVTAQVLSHSHVPVMVVRA